MEEQPGAPNTHAGPNLRRLVPLGVIFVVLVTVLMLLARDVIREVVVLPLSYLIYVVRLIVRTTPQIFFWAAALLVLALAAFRSLSARPRKLMPTPLRDDLDNGVTGPNRGRAHYWAVKVALARRGDSPYYVRAFHSALVHLLLEVLAYRYRITPNQVEEQLRAGTLYVPEDVREYALFALRREDALRGNAFTGWLRDVYAALVRALRRLMNRLTGRDPAAVAPREDPQVARILKFMEEELELEVLNDDANR